MTIITFQELTHITDFFGLIFSVWLMFYLLARGHSNPVTLRMALVLFSLSVYFLNSYFSGFLDSSTSITISTISVIVALTSIHNLTHQILPLEYRSKYRPIAYTILMLGLISTISLFVIPHLPYPEIPNRDFLPVGSPHIWIDFFDITAAVAIIANLRIIIRSRSELLSLTFYASLFFGVSTIGLAALTVLFKWSIPRYVSTLTILLAFISFGYSIARHQSLLDSRLSIRDFPLTALFIFLIAIVYALVARSLDLPTEFNAFLVFLAVTTHSAYDMLRAFLMRTYARRESTLRKELHLLARAPQPAALDSALRRALAILCHNLAAQSGFIALREGPVFRIHASFHSLPNGQVIDTASFPDDELFQPQTDLDFTWMRWSYAADQTVALIAVGPRSGARRYTESDLDWLDDVADHIGALVQTHNLVLQAGPSIEARRSASESEMNSLLSTLALNPGKHLLKNVEDAFRSLNDVSTLGESPLVTMLSAQGDTHIERGKSVQQKLLQSLETLRPEESGPPDPVPRRWYSYLILREAYVKDIPDREIMARLFISEGTFYRTRRKALRGITRAIIETAALE